MCRDSEKSRENSPASILPFRAGFGRPVLPARHHGSGWYLEPEETTHSGNVGSWKNDLPTRIANTSLGLLQVLDPNIVHAVRSLGTLGASDTESGPFRAPIAEIVAVRHLNFLEFPMKRLL